MIRSAFILSGLIACAVVGCGQTKPAPSPLPAPLNVAPETAQAPVPPAENRVAAPSLKKKDVAPAVAGKQAIAVQNAPPVKAQPPQPAAPQEPLLELAVSPDAVEYQRKRDDPSRKPNPREFMDMTYTPESFSGENFLRWESGNQGYDARNGYATRRALVFDQYFKHIEKPSPAACLEAACAYLMVGRFDSAERVLKKGLESTPDANDKDHEMLKRFVRHSQSVRETLTAARTELRRHNPAITYPDEALFVMALVRAPRDSDYLQLNLIDAYAAAHPTSKVALKHLAEANLTFYDQFFETQGTIMNDVPNPRREDGRWRGEGALKRLHDLDPADPYARVRAMTHALAINHRSAAWSIPGGDWKKDPQLADKPKAWLYYGDATLWLKHEDVWENPLGDLVVDLLKHAVELDPENMEYRATYEKVSTNKERINRLMQDIALRKNERSRAAAQELWGYKKRALEISANERLYHDTINGLFQLTVDEMRRKSPTAAEVLSSIGCVRCWGSGKGFYGKTCEACLGTGRRVGQ